MARYWLLPSAENSLATSSALLDKSAVNARFKVWPAATLNESVNVMTPEVCAGEAVAVGNEIGPMRVAPVSRFLILKSRKYSVPEVPLTLSAEVRPVRVKYMRRTSSKLSEAVTANLKSGTSCEPLAMSDVAGPLKVVVN